MTTADTDQPSWVPTWLIVLAIPQTIVGLWAYISPRTWFEQFPGMDPRLVAAEPPFNEHLASEAGAGFLTTAVLLLGAAWIGRLAATQLGLIGVTAFQGLHLIRHLLNPSDLLTTSEQVLNAGVLAFGVAAPLVLLGLLGRESDGSPDGDGAA